MSGTSTLDLNALGIRSYDASNAPTKKTNLDQGDFLKLLTTQLKNQDPLKPVENEAFVAQMAQFSSLSGITEMNTKLGNILEAMNQGQLSTATGLVGKYALTSGRSEEHTSELQSLMRNSYAVLCLKNKK